MAPNRFTVFSVTALLLAATGLQAQVQAPPGVSVQAHINFDGPAGITFSSDGATLFSTAFAGQIYRRPVFRNASNHVIGFGLPILHANAPFVEVGIGVGPGGTLFWTTADPATLTFGIGQLPPGGTPLNQSVSATGWVGNIGGLEFVPTGFPHAGEMMVGAKSNFFGCPVGRIGLSPNGNGTSNLAAGSATVDANTHATQAQGFAHIPAGPLAGNLAVTDFQAAVVWAMSLDPVLGNGSPTISSPVVAPMITGITACMGLAFDPITNDLFVVSFFYTIYQFSGTLSAPELLVPATYSSSSGSQVKIQANAGWARGGLPYAIAISVSGTSPGTVLGGVHIPLNPDALTLSVYAASLAGDPMWQGFAGTLNAAGVATATANPPGPIGPAFNGVTASLCLIGLGTPVFASRPVQFTVVP